MTGARNETPNCKLPAGGSGTAPPKLGGMAKKAKTVRPTALQIAAVFESLRELEGKIKYLTAMVEALPEEATYSRANLATLEDVRREALELAQECEAAVQVFEDRAAKGWPA